MKGIGLYAPHPANPRQCRVESSFHLFVGFTGMNGIEFIGNDQPAARLQAGMTRLNRLAPL